jgi:hypothetical protein
MQPSMMTSRALAEPSLQNLLQLGPEMNEAVRRSLVGAFTPWFELLAQSQRGARSSKHGCRCGDDPCRCGKSRDPWNHGDCGCKPDPCLELRPCGCDPCAPNPCDPCRCCIGDADLVIKARPGETLVTPFHLHNPRRREREVTVALSPWRACDGQVPGLTSSVAPTALKIEPCRDQQVLVTTKVPAGGQGNTGAARQPEWCGCHVFYANLSFEGCITRPVTLALAVLAHDCAPHDVHCGCCDCC